MARSRRTRQQAPKRGRYTPPRPRHGLEAVEGVTLDGAQLFVVARWCDDPECHGGCG